MGGQRGRNCETMDSTGVGSWVTPGLKIEFQHGFQNHLDMPPSVCVSCYLSFVAMKPPFSFLENAPWFWSDAAILWWQPVIPVHSTDINPWLPPQFPQRQGGRLGRQVTQQLPHSVPRHAGSQRLSSKSPPRFVSKMLPWRRCVFW